MPTASEGQELKRAGLKITLPRMKILEILETAEPSHMTAEDIYRRLLDSGEEIGLATVYRVLTQFEAAGLVHRLHFEGGQAVFELDRGHHHDHIVCVECGHVEEFFDSVIEARQKAIASENGFDIRDHSLILYGECMRAECPNRMARGA
ncbi:ferric iron uptake transcriptional regulator [Acidihalobacter ferrooxydans]|uniref:Ferric uptake regulation protein n=1 Tax=Acidihalobacter ferrooxydans TaxID=1765967 RepID=A0A1P8UEK9_9GAMM|nr:ferric iron uptake transcriptional regulator [Acidihalobacter ferrooxydans]APZ42229.1 ferric iron uptake transcriptional regulator [Acidihalobacter ferrooxydans]